MKPDAFKHQVFLYPILLYKKVDVHLYTSTFLYNLVIIYSASAITSKGISTETSL